MTGVFTHEVGVQMAQPVSIYADNWGTFGVQKRDLPGGGLRGFRVG